MITFREAVRHGVFYSLMFYFSVSHATTFLPVPLEQQLESVSAVIRGEFLGEMSKRAPNGDVITAMSFKLKSQSGLLPREVLNPNNFQVLVPGGNLDGVTYFVHGAPRFTVGEEAVLFLAKGPYGLHVYNLAMGKYNIVKEAGATWLSSEVFPTHGELGNISFDQLDAQLNKRFGQPLQEIQLNYSKVVVPTTDKKRRLPASVAKIPAREVASSETEADTFGNAWMLMLCLGLLGIISAHLARRSE